jgi:hypothetical protein
MMPAKTRSRQPFLLTLSMFLLASSPQALRAEQKPAPPFEPTLPWLDNLDSALAAAKESGKPILLEFR